MEEPYQRYKIRIVKKTLIFIFGILSVSCCRKALPIRSESKDSVRVEYKTEYKEKIRIDTVEVPVPAQSAQTQNRDSSSHLETDFAESDARINADGTLYHNLRNKPRMYPVAIPVKDAETTTIRDSIIYRDRNKEVPVPADLTKWQTFSIWVGRIAMLLMIGLLGWKIVRFTGKL